MPDEKLQPPKCVTVGFVAASLVSFGLMVVLRPYLNRRVESHGGSTWTEATVFDFVFEYIWAVHIVLWAAFAGIYWLIVSDPLRVVGVRVCGELPVEVMRQKRAPNQVVLRLKRAAVPGADGPWILTELPFVSVRYRVARTVASGSVRLNAHEVGQTLDAAPEDESAFAAVAANLVLIALCFAKDDGPALAWLTADHAPDIAARFDELVWDYAQGTPAATELSRRRATAAPGASHPSTPTPELSRPDGAFPARRHGSESPAGRDANGGFGQAPFPQNHAVTGGSAHLSARRFARHVPAVVGLMAAALLVGLVFDLSDLAPEDWRSNRDQDFVRSPLFLPICVFGGTWWVVARLVKWHRSKAERVVARRLCDRLPIEVLVLDSAPDRYLVRLTRTDVPGAAHPWRRDVLPANSGRGRVLARFAGSNLSVEPEKLSLFLHLEQRAESDLARAAAELVLVARCFADDDQSMIAWLTAEHPRAIAEYFAELLLLHASEAAIAAEMARRFAQAQSVRLRVVANWRLSDWPALSQAIAALQRPEPDLLDQVARAVAAEPDSDVIPSLLALWNAKLTQHTRILLQSVLAQRELMDAALEAGLGAQDELSVNLALDWYASHREALVLADRCAALLRVAGVGPPVVQAGDGRAVLWISAVSAGGSAAHLAILRRWLGAVDASGLAAVSARTAATSAVSKLVEGLPANEGGLSLFGEDAAGGLAVAEEGLLSSAPGGSVGDLTVKS
jgi:hypothetical protein